MQKIIALVGDIGPGLPDSFSETLGQHQGLVVDRVAVRVLAHPKNDGTGPTEDEVKALERMIAVQMWPDKQKNYPFILNGATVHGLKSEMLGPLPWAPFNQRDNNQFTVKWAAVSGNTFLMPGYTKASKLQLEVTLFGNDNTKV